MELFKNNTGTFFSETWYTYWSTHSYGMVAIALRCSCILSHFWRAIYRVAQKKVSHHQFFKKSH